MNGKFQGRSEKKIGANTTICCDFICRVRKTKEKLFVSKNFSLVKKMALSNLDQMLEQIKSTVFNDNLPVIFFVYIINDDDDDD